MRCFLFTQIDVVFCFYLNGTTGIFSSFFFFFIVRIFTCLWTLLYDYCIIVTLDDLLSLHHCFLSPFLPFYIFIQQVLE
ncbi:hypothetical protein STCU_10308 [Strigomonas culicis]|uniref:Uncharacterized protein n=1 Tax=Strigomonas culicis TaxID=28005 RepID=S9TNG0_9TRYP|nr:hypothetical protein STCU_10308 [Strigomonas culicis]|eukprot:EPY17928.1 hypothetical protein STCU_10308 [Strigomonas culicis]